MVSVLRDGTNYDAEIGIRFCFCSRCACHGGFLSFVAFSLWQCDFVSLCVCVQTAHSMDPVRSDQRRLPLHGEQQRTDVLHYPSLPHADGRHRGHRPQQVADEQGAGHLHDGFLRRLRHAERAAGVPDHQVSCLRPAWQQAKMQLTVLVTKVLSRSIPHSVQPPLRTPCSCGVTVRVCSSLSSRFRHEARIWCTVQSDAGSMRFNVQSGTGILFKVFASMSGVRQILQCPSCQGMLCVI